MNAIQKECIWFGECDGRCPKHCQDFSPADETDMDTEFYYKTLDERGEAYEDILAQFS